MTEPIKKALNKLVYRTDKRGKVSPEINVSPFNFSHTIHGKPLAKMIGQESTIYSMCSPKPIPMIFNQYSAKA